MELRATDIENAEASLTLEEQFNLYDWSEETTGIVRKRRGRSYVSNVVNIFSGSVVLVR